MAVIEMRLKGWQAEGRLLRAKGSYRTTGPTKRARMLLKVRRMRKGFTGTGKGLLRAMGVPTAQGLCRRHENRARSPQAENAKGYSRNEL